MLMLTRRIDKTLLIGDDATVSVLAIKGNQVRLGITVLRRLAYTSRRFTDTYSLLRDESTTL